MSKEDHQNKALPIFLALQQPFDW